MANDNCPGQLIISGHEQALEQAIYLARDAGAKRVVRLPVSIAAHSPVMESVVDEYHTLVHSKPFLSPQITVIANTTVAPLLTPEDIRTELCAQMTETVRWTETVELLRTQGITDFVELGSGDVLTRLVRRIDNTARGYAVSTPDAVKRIIDL